MEEITEIAQKILSKNEELEKMRGVVKERAARKSEAIANYDKELAIVMIKLRNGVEIDFEGQKILDPPTTIIEKISKGVCWKAKLELEQADSEYKSVITNMESVRAELNGLQSINKFLQ